MIFWHCTSCVPVISAKDMGLAWLCFLALSSMISNNEVDLGALPHGRRLPQIFIPSQLLKQQTIRDYC